MAALDFEGDKVPVEPGDTVASALFRSGVRTFSRSIKYHRRRGLYCMTGDCPNCLVTVDAQPGCRACITDAADGQVVRRESGVPSADLDLMAVMDKAHSLMPVGFYYKTFIRPRAAWKLAERVIRRSTGIGSLPIGAASSTSSHASRHVAVDVLVVGGGVAGFAAARSAASEGASVIVCDEGRIGDKVADPACRSLLLQLVEEISAMPSVTVLERHVAVGIYEGPLVPLAGPLETVRVDPGRIVVATGAVETHAVFPGNDLPGVWLGRGATRMAVIQGVVPASSAVVVADTAEGIRHIASLKEAAVHIVAAVVPGELESAVAPGLQVVTDAQVVSAQGRRRVRSVNLRTAAGDRRVPCDALILSVGYMPRDGLLRMAGDSPVVGAGDVVLPGCSLDEAVESGSAAGLGHASDRSVVVQAPLGRSGYVCLCEDVSAQDLHEAWGEGWHSSEILKRYTTATMGPCQGALCGRYLSEFSAKMLAGEEGLARSTDAAASSRTTARPPARPVSLDQLAAGVHEVIQKRTSLHGTHLSAGAKVAWSGSWMRPFNYGDAEREYRAVREGVSLMDVGTLGKFLIGGQDAQRLVDGVLPCRVTDLRPGRSRYLLALDEAGYAMDDGLLCALDGGRYYMTSTSGGADRMEAWLSNWADRWDLHVHLVNQTAMLGAINVAGPSARDLLSRLTDEPIDGATIPYPGHASRQIAGVPCRVIRVGFVGELSFELHHQRSRSAELWAALMEAGADMQIRPHGLDALDVLRLEKGHFYLGQDTLPDDHPGKLGLDWAVAMDKGPFLGRAALQRMESLPAERKLVGLAFEGPPQRGAPLHRGTSIVGRVTSCARSGALDAHIGLGWLRAIDGEFPAQVTAGGVPARVVATPFYDPSGERLRA